MVYFVETWLLTDQDALQKYFKQGFKQGLLPTTNLEARSKALLSGETGCVYAAKGMS